MAVYKRTYKAYRGAMTPTWSRFTVLSRYGFSTLFESRLFTAYTVVCIVPFLIGLAFIYLMHSSAAQALLGVRMGNVLEVNNKWFLNFLAVESWMGFVLTAWGAPGMISKDFANSSIQLYLSRPLSRAEYLVGKVSVLASLLSLTTWIPALILFGIHAGLQGDGWGWKNLWMAGSIFVGCMLWIALISLLAMAIGVWVRWRIAATALLFATFFLLPAFSEVMNLVLRTKWGRLLDLPYVIVIVWRHLFRIEPAGFSRTNVDSFPLWAAWMSVLAFCAFSVFLLNTRLKAREVSRG